MKHLVASLLLAAAVASLLAGGCTQAAPAAPTKAPAKPAEPTKATEPAKVAPTQAAAPVKKVDYPAKGKAITIIVPFTAGGGADTQARLTAPFLEKDLGTAVEVANKTGAGSQVGITALAQAKPDGYTFGITNLPTTISLYLDPARKAVFDRKSFQPVALHVVDLGAVAVKADSPYKTMKDLIDAAKANPGKIKASTTGRLSGPHLQLLDTEQLASVQFAAVHFDGAVEGTAALIGGKIDAQFGYVTNFMAPLKGGEIRVLGVMDKQGSKFLPDVKTMDAQGYKLYHDNSRGWSGPAGIPKEIVDMVSVALKKAMETEEHRGKMAQQGVEVRYMGPEEFGDYWAGMEDKVKVLQELAKQ